MILDSKRFIILDLSETEKQNNDIRNIDYIQIADPANKNAYVYINSVKQRYEEARSQMGKRELRSIITLNTAAENKNQSFR